MRITVHVPNTLAEDIRRAAASERKSISRFVADAIQWYIREVRKRRSIERVLRIAGSAEVAEDVLEALQNARGDRT